MEQPKETPKTTLYFSPNMSPEEVIAPLNEHTFVQRLNNLTQTIQALKELEKHVKKVRQ